MLCNTGGETQFLKSKLTTIFTTHMLSSSLCLVVIKISSSDIHAHTQSGSANKVIPDMVGVRRLTKTLLSNYLRFSCKQDRKLLRNVVFNRPF